MHGSTGGRWKRRGGPRRRPKAVGKQPEGDSGPVGRTPPPRQRPTQPSSPRLPRPLPRRPHRASLPARQPATPTPCRPDRHRARGPRTRLHRRRAPHAARHPTRPALTTQPRTVTSPCPSSDTEADADNVRHRGRQHRDRHTTPATPHATARTVSPRVPTFCQARPRPFAICRLPAAPPGLVWRKPLLDHPANYSPAPGHCEKQRNARSTGRRTFDIDIIRRTPSALPNHDPTGGRSLFIAERSYHLAFQGNHILTQRIPWIRTVDRNIRLNSTGIALHNDDTCSQQYRLSDIVSDK